MTNQTENFNEKEFTDLVKEALYNFSEEENSANILITGATGSGKSSLVNKVFNVDFAKVGVGRPVTQDTSIYEVDGIPIKLFDTKGYEIESEEHKRFLTEMRSYMEDEALTTDDQVHMVWYVIAASGHRVTDMDLEMLKNFKNTGKPICVVLTKCDQVSEETATILKTLLEDANFTTFLVSTKFKLELPNLIEWAYQNLNTSVQWAFLRSQKANLEFLKKEVNKYIKQHAGASFGIGFMPIPFADGPALLGNQAMMIARILNKYGLDNIYKQMETLVGTIGIGQVVSQLGRYLVAQILKLFPGVGTITGGLINGTVATALTVSLGYTISEIGYQIAKAKIADDKLDIEAFISKNFSTEIITKMFEQFVKKEMNDKKDL